jgi:hypothetical protein
MSNEPNFWPAISYAQVTQQSWYFRDERQRFVAVENSGSTCRVLNLDPNSCLRIIRDELDKTGVCDVNIYQDGSGHALLDYQASQVVGASEWRVYVYDSNQPGKVPWISVRHRVKHLAVQGRPGNAQ